MGLAEKISNAELRVMQLLWREGRAMSFADIRAALAQTTHWEKSTVNTLLRRLTEKGVISAQKEGVIFYAPNLSEAEYRQAEEQNLLDKLYQGSAKNLVAALCARGELTQADIAELHEFFQMGDEK